MWEVNLSFRGLTRKMCKFFSFYPHSCCTLLYFTVLCCAVLQQDLRCCVCLALQLLCLPVSSLHHMFFSTVICIYCLSQRAFQHQCVFTRVIITLSSGSFAFMPQPINYPLFIFKLLILLKYTMLPQIFGCP